MSQTNICVVSSSAAAVNFTRQDDDIDALVAHLHTTLANAQAHLSAEVFSALRDTVLSRLSSALAARAFATRQRPSSTARGASRTTEGQQQHHGAQVDAGQVSPPPWCPQLRGAPSSALVRRVVPSPSVSQETVLVQLDPQSTLRRSARGPRAVQRRSATDHVDENNGSIRTDCPQKAPTAVTVSSVSAAAAPSCSLAARSMRRAQSTNTTRLVIGDSTTEETEETDAGQHQPLLAASSDVPPVHTHAWHTSAATSSTHKNRSAHRMPHAASAALLPSCSPQAFSGDGAGGRPVSGTSDARAVLKRSASLATILSLVDDNNERYALSGSGAGPVGGGESSDTSGGVAHSATKPPRVVQYVRVSAAVAPVAIVRERFAAFLAHRRRRMVLTFSPSTLAPTMRPRSSTRDAASADRTLHRQSPRRYPLRVEVAQTPEKPVGFAAKKAELDTQGWYCKGCLVPFKARYGVLSRGLLFASLDDASFCYYTGGYFCARCLPPYRRGHLSLTDHARQRLHHAGITHPLTLAVVPARVLHDWDFTPYPVCARAYTLLMALEEEPLYCVSRVAAPGLYAKATPLLAVAHALRTQLVMMRDVGAQCPSFRHAFYGEASGQKGRDGVKRKARGLTVHTHNTVAEGEEGAARASTAYEQAYIPYTRRYLVETVDWWSLADLRELHRCDPEGVAGAELWEPSLPFAAASLSHSLASVFDSARPAAPPTSDSAHPPRDAERSPSDQGLDEVRLLMAEACTVLQTLRAHRRAMADHVMRCPCCVRHSVDVCRLCVPSSSLTGVSAAAVSRRELVDRHLHSLRRGAGSGSGQGSRTAVASALTSPAPSPERTSWADPEDLLLLFIRTVLQDEEKTHGRRGAPPRQEAQPRFVHAGGSRAGRCELSPSVSSASLARSPSAGVSLLEEPPLRSHESTGGFSASSTKPNSPTEVPRATRRGTTDGERSRLSNDRDAESEDDDGDEMERTVVDQLPRALLDHLVYTYDVMHVYRCGLCGSTYHRRCVAKKLGLALTNATDAKIDQQDSGTWCTTCQSQSTTTQL